MGDRETKWEETHQDIEIETAAGSRAWDILTAANSWATLWMIVGTLQKSCLDLAR